MLFRRTLHGWLFAAALMSPRLQGAQEPPAKRLSAIVGVAVEEYAKGRRCERQDHRVVRARRGDGLPQGRERRRQSADHRERSGGSTGARLAHGRRAAARHAGRARPNSRQVRARARRRGRARPADARVDLARGRKIFELELRTMPRPARRRRRAPGARDHAAAGGDRHRGHDERRVARADLSRDLGGRRRNVDAGVGGNAFARRSLGGRDVRELVARQRRRPCRRRGAAQGALRAVRHEFTAGPDAIRLAGRAQRLADRRGHHGRRHRDRFPRRWPALASRGDAGGRGTPRRTGHRRPGELGCRGSILAERRGPSRGAPRGRRTDRCPRFAAGRRRRSRVRRVHRVRAARDSGAHAQSRASSPTWSGTSPTSRAR